MEVKNLPAEYDYRFFRYSKLSLPLLILILGMFTTLILLTMWQSRSDIRSAKEGTPRDIEQASSLEGGIKKYKRNVRLAMSFLSIFFSLLAFIVFLADLKPILRAQINYVIGVSLLVTGALSWVGFGLDMNSERDAVQCRGGALFHSTRVCESREDIATCLSIFDALVAVFTIASGALVIAYTATGDWARQKTEYVGGFLYGTTGEIQPGLIPNGVSAVRKKITFLGLLFTLFFGIILLVFTILIHQYRETFTARDQFNRMLSTGLATQPGWPTRATALRYVACSLVILTVLFNLIPLTSRVIAYLIGFLYVLYAMMTYTCFGVDIAALSDAKDLPCPAGYNCVYHPYNATIAFDFIGATFLLIYVAWEYFISKRQKAIEASPQAQYE